MPSSILARIRGLSVTYLRDHARLERLEAEMKALKAGTASAAGTIIVNQTATPVSVQVNGTLIGTERIINFNSDGTINLVGTDNTGNTSIDVAVTAANTVQFLGDVDVGTGSTTGAGYSLTSTASAGAAVDSTQDLVIPAQPGQCFALVFNGEVQAGAGDAYFDILSVNSGNYAGQGISASGIDPLHVTASTTARLSVIVPYIVTGADLSNGSLTFRLVYRVASGTTKLLANDADGHFRLSIIGLGAVNVIGGASTGPPPVTPPAAGTLTDRGTTNGSGAGSGVVTFSSGSFTPTAGNVLLAISQTYLSNSGTQSLTIADTIGDGAGSTAWTARLDEQAAFPAPFSVGLKMWTRTVGATPGAGTITTTRNAGTMDWNETLTIIELHGCTETPTQSGAQEPTNVSSTTLSLTTPGANDLIITSIFNNTAGVATLTAPTTPTGMTSLDDAVRNGDGHATAYQIGGVGSAVTWAGLAVSAGPSPAGFLVFTPSGSSTPAPGTESWDHANKTTDINQDLTWTMRTV